MSAFQRCKVILVDLNKSEIKKISIINLNVKGYGPSSQGNTASIDENANSFHVQCCTFKKLKCCKKSPK